MRTKEKGISLITLVVTIVVMIIIATAVLITLYGEDGVITKAKEARLSTELTTYKEELNMYKMKKLTENPSFVGETLTAGKENLVYNTQKEGESGNIRNVISQISNKFFEKLEIIKGEMLINTQDKLEIRVAQSLGIEVNPYEIIDGVLISSNGNLLLMDEKTGTLTIPDTVIEIGEGAFANLEGLKTIIIPSTVKRIAQNAFAYNQTLENVIMQEKVNEDGEVEGVEYIGVSAFGNCKNLRTVQIADSVKEIATQAFHSCNNLQNIEMPVYLTKVGGNAFSTCYNITYVVFKESIENITIGAYAFSSCTNLEKVKLSSNVVSIDGTAFSNCSKLKGIEIAEENKNFKFENGILLGNEGKEMIVILESAIVNNELKIPNGVESLKADQINQYTNITKINIPESVTNIVASFFTKNITEVEISELNPKYEVINKAIYTKEITGNVEIVKYFGNEENVQIKEGTKIIKRLCFYNKSLSNIELPNSLEKIENQAFQGCKNLKNISLGVNINSFDNQSIYESGIESIEIDENNPNYSVRSGAKCNGEIVEALYSKDGSRFISPIKGIETIETYEIPESVVEGVNIIEIAAYAFHSQRRMISIKLPNTLQKIRLSFNYCSILEKIEIPSSVNEINTSCFANSGNLKEIRVHKSKGSIAGSPWGCIYGDKAVIWDE